MGPSGNPLTDKRRVLVFALLILALAAFLRFYNIGWSFSNNGVDEGIMLERARMVSEGYGLYSELPCDQAPLVFLLGSSFHGDVFQLRALTALFSLGAIVACMYTANRIRDNRAMLVTGLLLAVDFAFLRESRLFSLDGFSAFFLAFSLPLFVTYLRKDSRAALGLAGLLVGMSVSSKLFGAVALLGMLLFILLESYYGNKGRRKGVRAVTDCVILIVAAAVPVTMMLLALGPSEMMDGMLFDQGHRAFDLTMKLSIPLFFGFNLVYALPLIRARTTWAYSREERFLLVVSVVLLANFVLQPLVFLHHMILMSPGLAILSGVLVAREHKSRKGLQIDRTGTIGGKKEMTVLRTTTALLLVGVLVSAGLASYGLAAQGKPPQLVYAEKIAEWTTPSDWVISGDPLITAYAQRLTPPNLVNVGTRVYPELTVSEVEATVVEYNVSVFVVCYRFFESDMFGVAFFLAEHNYSKISAAYMGEWSSSAVETHENDQRPMVFVREDIIERFDLPTEGWIA